jgi:anti-sigma B factor antagonist
VSTSVTEISSPGLSVDVRTVTHTTVVISVDGRLDAACCPEIRAEVDRRIETGCQQLIFDLSHASFVDSVGLAALVKAMRDTQRIGAEFSIVRPTSDDAMRVFRLSKFDEVFNMQASI